MKIATAVLIGLVFATPVVSLAQDGSAHGPPGARPALPHGKASKPAATRTPASSPTRR
jgi:hypothetical protein